MYTDNISIEDGRRLNSSDLEKILINLPIRIRGTKNLRLKAHLGLGRIIYIKPLEGSVKEIELTYGMVIEADRDQSRSLIFRYEDQLYSLYYK